MDFKQIQELIKIVNRSNIGELRIEEGDFKIIIKQKEEPSPVYASSAPVQSFLPPPVTVPQTPAIAQAAPATATSNGSDNATGKQADNLITIKSPMIGTFYRSSGPDKPAFVNIGDEVTVGKTVCIIEAMKLFNEIESEVKGTIVKVLADDASPVEYDQPLFLVDPA
jgi:acetyl-CoA carboxylase biotin carboxyl carrier protein